MTFFFFWLASLCMTVSRSIHISADDTVSFLFMAKWYSIVYMYHMFFIPFLCWWTFKLLPSPGYCKYCCSEHWDACIVLNYDFLQYMPNSGIIGSCGSSVHTILHSVLHKVLHSGCINLHSHQQHKRVLYSLHPLQFLLFDDGHSDQHEMIIICSFDSFFSDN